MISAFVFLDAVSPIILAIPALLLIVLIAVITFGILYLIAYIRKRKNKQ